jgi:two-component system response regulator PilR (NtrC family)
LLELWTGSLAVDEWVDHERCDIDPESLSEQEIRAIESWIASSEADPSRGAAAWQVPGLARRLEAGSSRLEPELRLRLLATWRGLTARVQEPYAKAVALVALSEMAIWCVDSGSNAHVGLRVAELRADLGLAAGLFRRLGLHARATTCQEQWTLLTRLKIAPPRTGSNAEGGAAESVDAEYRDLWPLPSKRSSPALSLASVRRQAAAVGFVTRDGSLLRELGRLLVLSRSPLPVLIGGESGTGKEVIARAIHQWSGLDGEFVAIHCGAIPRELLESELFGHTRGAFTGAAGEKPGLVEVADGGTLFLDEIGEMGTEAQMKLLRVLESGEVRRVGDTRVRKVQVRIVAATHRDLPSLVAEREFRLDLYHRIRGLETRLSPLRDRRGDVVPLALHLLRPLRGRAALRLSDAAVGRLFAYDWPGNVRELKAVLLRAAYLSLALGSSVIEADILGLTLAPGVEPTFRAIPEPTPDAFEAVSDEVAELGLERTLERMERRIIAQALDENCWNRTRTAASLGGLSRTTLLSKMKRLGISEPLTSRKA